jgi:hypothetical protein
MLNWYDLASRQGTISIKASSETQAKEEAAERWGCSEDEIVCTGSTPYHGGRRLFA